jgi:DNA-directed RNA polymerase specialized sigma24 family protein
MQGTTPLAVLDDYRLWRFKMASVYLPYEPSLWPDLAQEAAIAQWRALDTYDPALGALPSWLTTAAKMRMREVIRRGNWTGTLGAKGHTREPPAIPVEITENDRITSDTFDLDAAMDVRAAVATLAPGQRKAIFDRFWLDLPVPTGLWQGAKPILRRRLKHLT